MQVYIAGDRADFRAEASDLVREHAGGWNLDSIIPVVVVVAQRIREVENGRF